MYQLTSLGIPRRLVGLNIIHIVSDFKQTDYKAVNSSTGFGDVPLESSPALAHGHRYLSLVGSLLWDSLTRHDIAVGVSLVCSRSTCPTKVDLAAFEVSTVHPSCEIDVP